MTDNGRVGIYVHGEFLSLGQGKPWTDSQGREHLPVVASVLVGDRVVRVEYRDADAAEVSCGSAARGDAIALPVFAQSPKGATTVFWRGR